MERKALEAMARHLRAIPNDDTWDMQQWKSACGTVGCAIGHCIDLPEVRATGLRLATAAVLVPEPYCVDIDILGFPVIIASRRYYPVQGYGDPVPNSSPFQEVAEALGITRKTAYYLFNGCCYKSPPSPNDVANRIEDVLILDTKTTNNGDTNGQALPQHSEQEIRQSSGVAS